MGDTSLVWFRQDLRLDDNEALHAAITAGPVAAVFIYDEASHGKWGYGGASKWWLHHSLNALAKDLAAHGISLIIRAGNYQKELLAVCKDLQATAVFWNRRYDPELIAVDKKIKDALSKHEIKCESFNGLLLREPWETLNKTNQPYQVFTPYWRARLAQGAYDGKPLARPRQIDAAKHRCKSLAIDDLKLLPTIKWDSSFYDEWEPGEHGARKTLKTFNAARYEELRNRPDVDGVSQISAHLHFGEISPRRIWQILSDDPGTTAAACYLRELGWREFSYYLLYHFPHTPTEELKKEFRELQWAANAKQSLRKWQRGLTGYPIVDAGMRQLWQTGWMHNRVRMIVASFLIKDLLIDWRAGADWFWDTLVDADLASNTQGWQWTAGCGADAAPFFRVFNPTLQGKKFDPDGLYVRKFVPELAKLDSNWIHCPEEAPADILAQAGVVLGKTYPKPVVDHNKAREKALFAYERMRRKPGAS